MDEFLAGRYQNEKGVQLDVLEDRCKPLIKSILDDVDRIKFAQSIGTTPTKVPGVCFRLCVKILKKKKYNTAAKRRHKKPTAKKKTVVKKEPTSGVQTEEAQTVVLVDDGSVTEIDSTQEEVDGLFDSQSSNQSSTPPVSYECFQCGDPIPSLDECYPEKNRKKKYANHWCKKCYDASNKLERQNNNNQRIRGEIKQRLVKKKIELDKKKKELEKRALDKNNSNARKKRVRKTVYQYRYDLHDRVLCKWTSGKGWFRADIFARYKGTYSVYFWDDGEVRRGVKETDMKPVPKKEKWAVLNRFDPKEFEFNHDDKNRAGCPTQLGRYIVRNTGKGRNINKYLCEYIGKKPIALKMSKFYFDMGYVLTKYHKESMG